MTVKIFVEYILSTPSSKITQAILLERYLNIPQILWHKQKQKVVPSSTKPPSDWSKALLTTVHKKDARSNPSNYRPISLACVGCTIMEHIMRNYISKHLSTNDIIIYHQHGFRQKFSCETQLISAIKLDVNAWLLNLRDIWLFGIVFLSRFHYSLFMFGIHPKIIS